MPVVQLPEQLVEALRQLLTDGEAYQWAVGDLITDAIAEYPQIHRSKLIESLADRTGADRSTLRDRHNMARFYPPKVRREFDMLSWSQLRACKSAGAEWRVYAEWAAGHMPAPVAVLRARIQNNGHDQPAWIGRWAGMVRLGKLILPDAEAPENIKAVIEHLLGVDEILASDQGDG